MIRSVRISGFKRFRDIDLHLPGHAVLTGPNDTGKTTLLQAIASWALALRRWQDLGDFKRRNGYRRAPIARQAFVTVPLRSFDLLWLDRRYRRTIEIELRHDAGWSVTMEFIADTTEQIYVRPGRDAPPDALREIDLAAVFVPPMTGVGLEEPLLLPPTIEHTLGLGRPGAVLRNVLADTCLNETVWDAVQAAISKLFGYRLLRPDTDGAHILADYMHQGREVRLDIASAGRGFQQVLLLLALLNTRPAAVLLLDQPDAHLHPTLQHAIYRELRSAATRARLAAHRRHPLRSAHQRRQPSRTYRDAHGHPGGRSTKAGTVVPATHGLQPRDAHRGIARSTKAGTVVPATRDRCPKLVCAVPPYAQRRPGP